MMPKSKRLQRFIITLFLLLSIPSVGLAQNKVVMKFGVLPALQALPLFVAESKNIFPKFGLDVDLILFNTAAEKDIALASGSLDGCFADLVTPLVLKGNGRDIVIVAKSYDTRHDRRMFAILAKPGSNASSVKDLDGKPVAIASNTVVDLVNEKLQTQAGVPMDKINTIESKNIGLRFQALLNGQLEAAALPEPLVTVAVSKGARVLIDDAGIGESQTALVFTRDFVANHPELVKNFLAALQAANDLINSDPDSVRDIMVEKVRLPAALKLQYPVPRFPKLAVPDRDALENIAGWLKQRGVIRSTVSYEQVVNGELIP